MLVQIPLLLQDLTQAQAVCAEWIRSGGKDGDFIGANWARESIEFIADPSQQPFDPSSPDLLERFFANFQMALLRYAEGEVDESIRHLEMCPTHPAGFWQRWGDAFREAFHR
jgi:hypothetical protein